MNYSNGPSTGEIESASRKRERAGLPHQEKPQQEEPLSQQFRCPMCNSQKSERQGTVAGYTFYGCKNCGFVFCPEITPEYLSRLYAEGYHGPEDGAPQTGWNDNPEFMDPAFELLEKKKPLQIMDFGTGQSLIPNKLRQEGHTVTAIDVVPPLEPHPDRLTGNLLELDLEDNKYDLIFSFQVFEHLPQPVPILERLLELTAEDGLLLIHTDMETPEREENAFEDWWYVAPPDHCAFFRIKTFKVFLKDKPYEIVYDDAKRVIIQKK